MAATASLRAAWRGENISWRKRQYHQHGMAKTAAAIMARK